MMNVARKEVTKHPVLQLILKSCKQGTCTVAKISESKMNNETSV